MPDPTVFYQAITTSADQVRFTDCLFDPCNVHVELESLSGDRVTVCLEAAEVEQVRDAFTDWLAFVDAEENP